MKRCCAVDLSRSWTVGMPCVNPAEHAGPCKYADARMHFDPHDTCLNCGEGSRSHVALGDGGVRCLFAPTQYETLKGWGSG